MKKLLITTALVAAAIICHAQNAAIGTRHLVDPNKPAEVARQLTATQGNVTVKAEGGKIIYTVAPGDNEYPGAAFKSLDGKPWDFSPFGRVEARVTNTSDMPLNVAMRVDPVGDWQKYNSSGIWLQPGESKLLKVYPGYNDAVHKTEHAVDMKAIAQVLLFLVGKSDATRAFAVEDLVAIGPAGEKPPADPNTLREVIAKDGHIFGGRTSTSAAARFNATQLDPRNATAELSADKSKITTTFADNGVVRITPAEYPWNFKHGNAIAITLKNTGRVAATPSLRVLSDNASTDTTALEKPLAAGATATLTVSFIPKKPWFAEAGGDHYVMRGGTQFENVRATAIELFANDGAQLEITALRLVARTAVLPPWLGKQPPVPQAEWKNWRQTLNENFDKPLDYKMWSVHADNWHDKRTHFTKDNTFVDPKNKQLVLRYEKKRGFHNDDPESKAAGAGETDYATGNADTFGKWTQRYGYFEARMKTPAADGLWLAFWTMPDRGHPVERWTRSSTHDGGMELDIMENLSGWGRYRFNQAFHWDGYNEGHKSVGSAWVYVEADKDDFITIGMLWLPGLCVYYSNGAEIGRWEDPRVCSVQSRILLTLGSGGWANTPLDDTQLPDAFVIDYLRVWQRNDLATPQDGHKPNKGLLWHDYEMGWQPSSNPNP